MRLMILGKGSVSADVFIEFLIEFRKRLIKNAACEIFLIVDRGSAHWAKKAGTFAPTPTGNCACSFRRLMGQPATPARCSASTGKRPAAWR
jgi:hypothetical protein